MRTEQVFIKALTTLLFWLPACEALAQGFFSSPDLSAKVTDIKTGEPITDAVVVTFWKMQKLTTPAFGHHHEILQRIDTVTDGRGTFRLKAWGPKAADRSWRMGIDSPYAYVLKSGYKFEIISNYSDGFGGFACPGSLLAEITIGPDVPTHKHSVIVASWNACEIKLKRPLEDPEQYADRLSWIRRDLCESKEGSQCSEALSKYFSSEKQRLSALGAKRVLW